MLRSLASLCVMTAAALGPAGAAEGGYVVCDNGLRCFTQPCPSRSALELAGGKVVKGVTVDTDALSQKDKAQLGDDALYYGRLVLRGHIETRTRTFHGKPDSLPFLVATGVERQSKAAERRHCMARRGAG